MLWLFRFLFRRRLAKRVFLALGLFRRPVKGAGKDRRLLGLLCGRRLGGFRRLPGYRGGISSG